MDYININNDVFIKEQIGNAMFVFSTAENELDFNINKVDFKHNIDKLKNYFGVLDVGYLKQIHSDKVYNYNGEISEGDGLITNKKKIALGIFTADCAPILLYDEKQEVIAAIHSGWKGTMSNIVSEAINKMGMDYNCCAKDIYLIIGPHIRECCYNIGEDLIEEFNKNKRFNKDYFCNGKLDMSQYIINDAIKCGLDLKKINDMHLCTMCSNEAKFHSYRRDKQKSGRQISLVYLI